MSGIHCFLLSATGPRPTRATGGAITDSVISGQLMRSHRFTETGVFTVLEVGTLYKTYQDIAGETTTTGTLEVGPLTITHSGVDRTIRYRIR